MPATNPRCALKGTIDLIEELWPNFFCRHLSSSSLFSPSSASLSFVLFFVFPLLLPLSLSSLLLHFLLLWFLSPLLLALYFLLLLLSALSPSLTLLLPPLVALSPFSSSYPLLTLFLFHGSLSLIYFNLSSLSSSLSFFSFSPPLPSLSLASALLSFSLLFSFRLPVSTGRLFSHSVDALRRKGTFAIARCLSPKPSAARHQVVPTCCRVTCYFE